jgi:hypothetical protein
VAVTPSGTDGIQLVKRFLNDLQHGQASPVTTRSGSSTSALPSLFRLLFGGNTVRLLAAIFAANALETRGEWTVYAPDSEIRSAMLRRLRRDVADEPAQIRFTVVDPEETKVARYLHAFAYVESRRASERNLEMLNQLPMQLGVSTERADDLIQDIFAARPACPLGGEYVLSAGQEAASWTSTAWSTEPRGAFNQVPDDYRFPFLAWFRGTDLRFTLSRDTLRADAVLWVGNGNPARSAGENAAPHGPSTVAARSAQEVEAGDRVFVNAANAELRLGNRTLATLPRGTSLSVLEIQKGWIGVETESRRSRLRGWVRRRHLQKR